MYLLCIITMESGPSQHIQHSTDGTTSITITHIMHGVFLTRPTQRACPKPCTHEGEEGKPAKNSQKHKTPRSTKNPPPSLPKKNATPHNLRNRNRCTLRTRWQTTCHSYMPLDPTERDVNPFLIQAGIRAVNKLVLTLSIHDHEITMIKREPATPSEQDLPFYLKGA